MPRTEIGIISPTKQSATDYLGAKGTSWVAWRFDPDWGPQLIADWDYTPTLSGRFFRQVMTGKR